MNKIMKRFDTSKQEKSYNEAYAAEKYVVNDILPRCEKTVFRVSDLVRHKLGCTATEDS